MPLTEHDLRSPAAVLIAIRKACIEYHEVAGKEHLPLVEHALLEDMQVCCLLTACATYTDRLSAEY